LTLGDVPADGQKRTQIRFGDSDCISKPVSDQIATVDPAPDRAGTYAKHFGGLGNGEEQDSLVPIITMALRTPNCVPNA
jgi:hypothetical protein